MKKDTSDLFEEEIMENELAEALEHEQTALLEIELEKTSKTSFLYSAKRANLCYNDEVN